MNILEQIEILSGLEYINLQDSLVFNIDDSHMPNSNAIMILNLEIQKEIF